MTVLDRVVGRPVRSIKPPYLCYVEHLGYDDAAFSLHETEQEAIDMGIDHVTTSGIYNVYLVVAQDTRGEIMLLWYGGRAETMHGDGIEAIWTDVVSPTRKRITDFFAQLTTFPPQ